MTFKPDRKNDMRHKLIPGLATVKHGSNVVLKGLKEIEAVIGSIEPGIIKPQPLIVSPTGGPVRDVDNHGMGHFGAPRGPRQHKGTDYVGIPGQHILSPIDGVIVREARPYANDTRYSGLLICGKHLYVKLFYIEPDWSVMGAGVFKGKTVIGIMQNIGLKHPGITPHVHLQAMVDPEILRA